MPNFLQSATNWLGNIINPMPQPTGLFQTRVTHTPGGVVPLGPGQAGGYDPSQDPLQAISGAPLSPEEKATLAHMWGGQQGFVGLAPGFQNRSDILRHEQLHALYTLANLAPHAQQIAASIDPGLVQNIHQNPIYTDEIKNLGEVPTTAEEGMAYSLAVPPGGGTPDPRVYHLVNALLASQPQRQAQLKALTYPGSRPQSSQSRK